MQAAASRAPDRRARRRRPILLFPEMIDTMSMSAL